VRADGRVRLAEPVEQAKRLAVFARAERDLWPGLSKRSISGRSTIGWAAPCSRPILTRGVSHCRRVWTASVSNARAATTSEIAPALGAHRVLFGHSFVLTGGRTPRSDLDLTRTSRRTTSASGLGVAMFFAISGYLVTQSFRRGETGGLRRGRILRIYPP